MMEQDKADVGKVGTTTRRNLNFMGGYLNFELNLTASSGKWWEVM